MSKKDFILQFGMGKNIDVQATAGAMPEQFNFCIHVGNVKITKPRGGKQGTIHITTGRADSLEGGDFKVSELEKAIQEFFDKNF